MNYQSQQYYQKANQKKLAFLSFILLLLVIAFVIDVCSGPGMLSLKDIVITIASPKNATAQLQLIVWDIRMPVALMAILTGAMLAAAGAQMQTILNNPLAEPFILGVSSAASFGAAIPIVFGFALFNQSLLTGIESTVFAFVFSMLATCILYAFTILKNAASETIILIGIALLFTFNALLSLLQYTANDAQLSEIVFWMMGSLNRSNWYSVGLSSLVFLFIIPWFMCRAWALTTLRMGEEKAQSLGVNVKRLRVETLFGVSLLTATAVSFSGTIAFVGLVGPHMARMIVGEDQRFFLPMAVLCGALLMSLTSILSKTISMGVVYPVGIITSLIGIPFFLALIMKNQKRNW